MSRRDEQLREFARSHKQIYSTATTEFGSLTTDLALARQRIVFLEKENSELRRQLDKRARSHEHEEKHREHRVQAHLKTAGVPELPSTGGDFKSLPWPARRMAFDLYEKQNPHIRCHHCGGNTLDPSPRVPWEGWASMRPETGWYSCLTCTKTYSAGQAG